MLSPAKGWRFVKLIPLLLVLGGKRVRLEHCPDPCDVILLDDRHCMMARSGNLRPWWIEDAQTLAAITLTFGRKDVRGTWLVWDIDNDVHSMYIDLPSDPRRVAEEAKEKYENLGRINHRSDRGKAYCPRCPVARRCLAMDIERGEVETMDFLAGYETDL